MLEKDLDIEMYDEEKDLLEDFGIGRTASTCTARLTIINGKTFLHLICKNACAYGKETKAYSYDMTNKHVCKNSNISINISDETYDAINKMYC